VPQLRGNGPILWLNSEEVEETEQQAFENAIMEVHRQYNLWSKKIDETSPKKVTETKKVVETKKSPEPSTKNIPEKGNVEDPAKRNLTILQISTQTEVSSANPPNNFS
jgi:predicted  nucleic acid-binding Zn-ribbon protein